MQRRSVALSQGQISYLTARPEGPPVARLLLLHGGGFDSAEISWGGLIDPLAAAGIEVFAPDHPGYGHSDRFPTPQRQAELLAYLAELADALDLADAHLGGISMGGALALGHALDHPVAGLILVGPHGVTPGFGRLGGWATELWVRSGLGARIGLWTMRRPRLLRMAMQNLVRDVDALEPALLDLIRDSATVGTAAVFEEWQRGEISPTGFATNYTPRLPELTCPVLFLAGEEDPGVPLTCVVAAAAQVVESRLVVIPGGKHWVQRDAPDVALREMIAFVERTCPGR